MFRSIRLLVPMAVVVLAACGDSAGGPDSGSTPTATPMHLQAPANQGELWACKFSVDPVTKLPNGDVTTGAITATIASGDGVLEAGVSGGNSSQVGYNAPGVPQCVKVWSGGTAATVQVTEAPGEGSAAYFYRFARRAPGATYDDVYFESPVFNPPSTTPVTASIDVTAGAAYEVWFKNVKAVPPPSGGCTYTQGFWKTHSDRGPAPYSSGWQALGLAEEDTPFFNSGASWYTVFWTAPRGGNAFYILAHQYMAAKLNALNGAGTTPEVDDALSSAESLFGGLAAGATTIDSALRADALAWASTLDAYNNGVTGPGHCE